MRRTRGWLTRSRAAILVATGTIGSALILYNHLTSGTRFIAQLERVLPLSAAFSAAAVGDWVAARQAQATLLAGLASAAVVDGRSAGDALRGALPVVQRLGQYRAAGVDTISRRRPALTVRTVDDTLTVLDAHAAITRGVDTIGWVTLSSDVTEATFTQFNVADTSDRTQRTSLLFLGRDSLALVTVSAAGGARAARPGTASVPRGLSLVATTAQATQRAGTIARSGIGTGLFGDTVVYAHAPVPGTPLLLVRERAVRELRDLLRPSLAITDITFTLLLLLLLGVTAALWRGAHLRRENESVQLRSAFVSSVSHELRTPLTQIRMYAEMLRLGLLPSADDSARALGVIEKESDRLSMLVERALSMTHDGTPPVDAPATPLRLLDAVQAACATITPLARERESTLAVDVDPDVAVQMDRDALQQVLLNLLDNAIKYGPRGQTIRVGTHPHGAQVQLAVEDQGPGVPPSERDVIWKPFIRGERAEASGAVGSGIGLAVVDSLVRRAGGRCWVESPRVAGDAPTRAAASGARFVVELPVFIPPAADRRDT